MIFLLGPVMEAGIYKSKTEILVQIPIWVFATVDFGLHSTNIHGCDVFYPQTFRFHHGESEFACQKVFRITILLLWAHGLPLYASLHNLHSLKRLVYQVARGTPINDTNPDGNLTEGSDNSWLGELPFSD